MNHWNGLVSPRIFRPIAPRRRRRLAPRFHRWFFRAARAGGPRVLVGVSIFALLVGFSLLSMSVIPSPTTSASAIDIPLTGHNGPDGGAATPEAADEEHADHRGGDHAGHDAAACEPTADQQAAADELVAATIIGLAAYPTPAEAEAAGYELVGRRGPEAGDGLNGTWHYINRAYIDDPTALDASTIESIIYGRTPDGGVAAIGAMYVMPRGVEGLEIGGCLTPWHTHTFRGFTTTEMLHVWTVDILGGAFAHEGSPYYACAVLGRTGIGTEALIIPPDCEARARGDGLSAVRSEIAAFLGITPEELRAARRSGQSLLDIAGDAGVSQADLEAFLLGLAQQRLDLAVADGRMTETKAADVITRVEENIDDLIDREGSRADRRADRIEDRREERGDRRPRADRDGVTPEPAAIVVA